MRLFIISSIILITGYIFFNPQHNCNWEECPAIKDYEQFSDDWCIKDLHMRNPEWSYEDCEYILQVDCKDTMIN
jgi:hypothetical protein